MRFYQAFISFMCRGTPLLALLSVSLLGFVSGSAAQEIPASVEKYHVGAQRGEPPYYPTVGTERFDYSVEHYCGYCVIVVGGLHMFGQFIRSKEFPLGYDCEATLYSQSGPLRVVARVQGHLDVYAGASQNPLVRFGASGMLPPPTDPESTPSVEISRLCYELGLPPRFYF